MLDLVNVVCVKWGNWCAPLGAEYVNKLYQGVQENLTIPHRFICFCDDSTGLDPAIEVRPLPENLTGWWWNHLYAQTKKPLVRKILAIPYRLFRAKDSRRGIGDDRYLSPQPIDLRGWYNKLFLFKPGQLQGQTVFLDLDTTIRGNLDPLFSYKGDLCILRDFYHPPHYQSSLLSFRPEKLSVLWTEFVRQGCPVMWMGDQRFIEANFSNADFFQDLFPGQVVSYKAHCQEEGVPANARVVCFHGSPRPHEVPGYF